MNMTTRPDIRFYDTSSLLIAGERLFEREDTFLVSSITFSELERIKTSNNKDPDIKYAARHLLHLFDSYPEKYTLVIHTLNNEEWIKTNELDVTDDTRILSDAIAYDKKYRPDETVFVTNDLSLKYIANLYFGQDMIESVHEEEDDYLGYKVVTPNDDQLAAFYQNIDTNIWELKVGEYLIITNQENEVVDARCWDGQTHRYLKYDGFNSKWFGKITPKDIYQKLAMDAIANNKISYIGGPAGSGKTFLSFGYLFNQLETHKIDHIVVFCNPVVAKNAAKLGYYPGSMVEKIMSSQVGNVLSSKIGDPNEVDRLIAENKLILIPAGDSRGYQTPPNSGIYILEAQNYDVTLLRLLLQRVDDSSFVICDGDKLEQTDLAVYSGDSNGLRKMSKIFRGHDCYGQVELKEIYRSEIGRIAEGMK